MELNGSWFDPSNPIIKRKDKPRSDIYEKAENISTSTDLVLVLGSSLTSSPGTFIPETVSQRSLDGECLGVVIVGLQQTPLDDVSTLRVFTDLDVFLKMLSDRLKIITSFNLDMTRKLIHSHKVPYDRGGQLTKIKEEMITLDLSQGKEVVMTRDGRVGRVIRYCATQTAWELEVQGDKLLLGWWWMYQVCLYHYWCCQGRDKYLFIARQSMEKYDVYQ